MSLLFVCDLCSHETAEPMPRLLVYAAGKPAGGKPTGALDVCTDDAVALGRMLPQRGHVPRGGKSPRCVVCARPARTILLLYWQPQTTGNAYSHRGMLCARHAAPILARLTPSRGPSTPVRARRYPAALSCLTLLSAVASAART